MLRIELPHQLLKREGREGETIGRADEVARAAANVAVSVADREALLEAIGFMENATAEEFESMLTAENLRPEKSEAGQVAVQSQFRLVA